MIEGEDQGRVLPVESGRLQPKSDTTSWFIFPGDWNHSNLSPLCLFYLHLLKLITQDDVFSSYIILGN